MIPVTLSKTGNPMYYTQHFGINDWKIQPMIIPRCGRCFGIFIFWEAVVEGKAIYSITGLHLPPGTPKYTKYIGKKILCKLVKDLPLSRPYFIIACGGNIDTAQNRFYYKKSCQHYLDPLERLFPHIEIQMFTVEKNIVQSSMYLHADGTVSAKLYYPIT